MADYIPHRNCAGFSSGICICAFSGFLIQTHRRLTTPCLYCAQQQFRWVNGIRETCPTGCGTGTFYVCGVCLRRWFRSNDDREFRDASGSEYDS